MTRPNSPRGVLTSSLLLWFALVALIAASIITGAAGEEQQQQPPPLSCDCATLTANHEKCVADYWGVEESRKALEQQIQSAEAQANERCGTEVQQIQAERDAQAQAHAQAQTQAQQLAAQLKQIQRESQDQLVQCQGQHQTVQAQAQQEVETVQRRLQETSQQLTAELEQHKMEKVKLQGDVNKFKEALETSKHTVTKTRRELKDLQKTMDEIQASKTIITIDYDLLQERLEEIKQIIMTHIGTAQAFVVEQYEFVKAKFLEGWNFVQTEVFPEIERYITKEAIPFVEKSWKQACDFWEETYAPYRGPVNQTIEDTKKAITKAYKEHIVPPYKQHVEPKVKEYKLDQHAATAQAKAREAVEEAEKYMRLAHEELSGAIKTATNVALNFVKLEFKDAPPFITENLKKANKNHELIALFLEFFVAFFVGMNILKWLLSPRKVPKKSKKQLWEEKQLAEQQNGKKSSSGNKNKTTPTNGAKALKKKQK